MTSLWEVIFSATGDLQTYAKMRTMIYRHQHY